MKKILRNFITNSIVFFILSEYTTLLSQANISQILIASITFTLIHYLAKPMLHLLWLPINLITLGLLSWVPLTFMLVLTFIMTQGISIHSYSIHQFDFGPIHLPNIHFGSLSSIIILTFSYMILKRIIRWATK